MAQVASSPGPFDWAEVSPGRYERAMDMREALIIEHTQRPTSKETGCPFYAVTFLKLSYSFPEDEICPRLRDAWRFMRLHHPSLASFPVDGAQRMAYETPKSREDVDEWVDKTFKIDTSGQRAEELAPFVDTTTNLAFLMFLPKTGEILLGFNHILIDGGGVILFVDTLLRRLVDASPAPEQLVPNQDVATALCLPLQALVGTATPRSAVWDEARAVVREWSHKRRQVPGTISLQPTGDLNSPPRWSRQVRILLPEDETAHLLAATKAARLTLSVATHAAVILASRKHGGEAANGGRNWVSSLVVSFRHRARPPYNTSRYPLSIMSAGFPQVIEDPVEFAGTAAKLKAAYKYWQLNDDVVDMLGPIKQAIEEDEGMRGVLLVGQKYSVANASALGVLTDLKEEYGEKGEVKVLDFAGGMREPGKHPEEVPPIRLAYDSGFVWELC